MITKQINQFRTYDLALAATLVAYGIPIESLEWQSESGKAAFIFTHDSNTNEIVQLYWSKNLKVEPRLYFDSIKHLKTMLYAEMR